MSRQRQNTPTAAQQRRTRNGSPSEPAQRRTRRRAGVADPGDQVDLSEEELRALADENIDPEEALRLAREDTEQEASEHDRDTPRDRIEGLLLEQDEEY
jgi:hypothetical protein